MQVDSEGGMEIFAERVSDAYNNAVGPGDLLLICDPCCLYAGTPSSSFPADCPLTDPVGLPASRSFMAGARPYLKWSTMLSILLHCARVRGPVVRLN